MYKLNVSKNVVHLFNGNADGDEPVAVEVEGKKFVDDGTGKAKLGDDGQPIPFVEKVVVDKSFDAAKADLEKLGEINPLVAKMLEANKKFGDDIAVKEEETQKAITKELEEKGEFKTLAETRATEIVEKDKTIAQKDEQLGKYVKTVESILEATLATIPKENISLIPAEFSARQKLEYISQNSKILGAQLTAVKQGEGVDKNDLNANTSEEEVLSVEVDELMKKPNKTKQELDILYDKSKKLTRIRKARIVKEEKENE